MCFLYGMNTEYEKQQLRAWSEEEFCGAQLGDWRRNGRLVSIAAAVAQKPAGTVTGVFRTSGSREGAFRFLENEAITPEAVGQAAFRACAARCTSERLVFVPVDGSSLNITDRSGNKGLGPVGSRRLKGRGVKVISALALTADGTPLGLADQRYWARPAQRWTKHRNRRPLADKETGKWLECIEQTAQTFAEMSPQSRLWFQLDREGDFHELLKWAEQSNHYLTVRGNHNRRLAGPQRTYLRHKLFRQPLWGYYRVNVPGRGNRRARRAKIAVRACRVTLRLHDRRTNRCDTATLWVVWAREVLTTPRGEKPIEWLLLSNYEVRDFAGAQRVIFGYTLRWRVEEFHRTWKSSCGVEQTQLRSYAAIVKWATILAAVAMRTERLKYLARNEPEQPASVELSADEIEAMLLVKHPEHYGQGYMPDIHRAVEWIAELGGYTGKSSGGPPGATVISRGLKFLESAVIAHINLSKMKSDQ